ncbi:hypothetical protein BD410DRAFT_867191 [Rickenella mellea]|uniref:Uncharacterized protein n=1 Tax=Rickenella mellea TaxID=50990 RepID=A0A4Y7Q1I4_9AGAM|nr:hypothetical protein BD410DRAFT_867191 [Rickenella mellea]
MHVVAQTSLEVRRSAFGDGRDGKDGKDTGIKFFNLDFRRIDMRWMVMVVVMVIALQVWCFVEDGRWKILRRGKGCRRVAGGRANVKMEMQRRYMRRAYMRQPRKKITTMRGISLSIDHYAQKPLKSKSTERSLCLKFQRTRNYARRVHAAPDQRFLSMLRWNSSSERSNAFAGCHAINCHCRYMQLIVRAPIVHAANLVWTTAGRKAQGVECIEKAVRWRRGHAPPALSCSCYVAWRYAHTRVCLSGRRFCVLLLEGDISVLCISGEITDNGCRIGWVISWMADSAKMVMMMDFGDRAAWRAMTENHESRMAGPDWMEGMTMTKWVLSNGRSKVTLAGGKGLD